PPRSGLPLVAGRSPVMLPPKATLRAGLSLYRLRGGEPIGFRPLDQPDQLGAALERVGQRKPIAVGALRLGQPAIERLAFSAQTGERLLRPARALPQRLELPPALGGKAAARPAAVGLGWS